MHRKLLAFFGPLSLMPFFIFATHAMTDAALARLPSPEVMLAAFAVAKSLSHVLISPTLVQRQVTVAMVESDVAYRPVRDVLRVATAAVFVIMSIIAFTPISDWVFGRVMGLGSSPVFPVARNGFKLMVFLPLASYLRNVRQGIAIRLGRTKLVAAATAVRVVVIGVVLITAVRTGFVSGMSVATAVWVGGMAMEGLLLSLVIVLHHGTNYRATRHIARRSGTREDDAALTRRVVGRFYFPLIAMPALGMLVLPSINANLARMPNSAVAIAAFSVAYGLASLMASPTLMLYQAVLAFYRNGAAENRHIRSFCLMVGVGLSATLALLAISPFGRWFAGNIMGLSDELAGLTVMALALFSLMPLVSSWRDYSWGVLMHHRRSGMVGVGRAFNLMAVWLVMASTVLLQRAGLLPLPAAAAGAAALVCGDLAEALFVAYRAGRCPG